MQELNSAIEMLRSGTGSISSAGTRPSAGASRTAHIPATAADALLVLIFQATSSPHHTLPKSTVRASLVSVGFSEFQINAAVHRLIEAGSIEPQEGSNFNIEYDDYALTSTGVGQVLSRENELQDFYIPLQADEQQEWTFADYMAAE